MKTALSALAVFCTTALAFSAEEPPAAATKTKPTAAQPAKKVAKCSKCSHAPCRCGYSPSYYTHYRKPVRRVETPKAPVTPHWTRPRAAGPVLTEPVEPSPRVARVVPSVEPKVRLGNDPEVTRQANAAERYRRNTTSNSLLSGPRRGHVVPQTTKRVSQTIVPSPRRPRAVPSITPKTRLGYDPNRAAAWSRSHSRAYRNSSKR